MRKNMKRIISFALMLSLLVGMMAGFHVFAEEETAVEIVSKNVYYADDLKLMYGVKATGDYDTMVVTVYDSENNEVETITEHFTETSMNFEAFISQNGVPAQSIYTEFYAVAKLYKGEEVVATSKTVRYSVLEYLYERLVGTKARDDQRVMYKNLLAYADSLGAVLKQDGKTLDLVSEYAYVVVNNGTVDGTYSAAMLKAGTALDSLAKDESFTVENGNVLAWNVKAYELGMSASETVVKDDAIGEFVVEAGKVYEIAPTSVESGAVSTTTVSTTIADYAAANGWTEPTKYVTIDLDANVTVTTNGAGNTGKYYTADGGAWRLYQSDNATMTIAAVEGKKIVTVKVAYVVSNTGILTLNGATVESQEEITVNAPSVTFVVGNSGSATNGQARITSIEVVYTDVPAHDCQFSEATCTEPATCSICGATDGKALGHNYDAGVVTTPAKCTTAGVMTYTCGCGDTYTEDIPATGKHTTDSGVCSECGQQIGGTTQSSVVLEITKDDFNSSSYDANNNTKTEGSYSYTSYQVMNQSSVMQWQKSKGKITLTGYEFAKLEIKVTAGTFTVTVGGKTVTGTTSNGVTTYDLTGYTGEIVISVGGATGKVDYIKFYK